MRRLRTSQIDGETCASSCSDTTTAMLRPGNHRPQQIAAWCKSDHLASAGGEWACCELHCHRCRTVRAEGLLQLLKLADNASQYRWCKTDRVEVAKSAKGWVNAY